MNAPMGEPVNETVKLLLSKEKTLLLKVINFSNGFGSILMFLIASFCCAFPLNFLKKLFLQL